MTLSERWPHIRRLAVAALVGGLIAGSVDIVVAVIIYSANPVKILQGIASGLLGPASFQGGAQTVVLGLVPQWFMSVIIAAIYVFSTLKIPALLQKPTRFGALYGVGIFLVMKFVVLPLSAVQPRPKLAFTDADFRLSGLLGFFAMIGFGLILAWVPRLMRVAASGTVSVK